MMNSNDISLTITDRFVGLFSPAKMNQRVRSKQATRAMDIAMRGLFKSAERNRLNADWTVPTTFDINRVLATELPLIRARSRWLMVNNSDAKSAQNAMCNYIVGTGFTLQPNVHEVQYDKAGNSEIVELDNINTQIEFAHADWCEDVYLTTASNSPMSYHEFQMMALERWIQDGEVFVHVEPDRTNIMRVEFIEPEALDIWLTTGENGNPVILGVEIDKSSYTPVAYWIMQSSPELTGYQPGKSIRVDADKIIHAFIRKYPKQLRGIPWLSAVIDRINQTDGYRTAQLIRNKIAAMFGVLFSGDGVTGKKMFTDGNEVESSGDSSGNFPVDANGNPITTLAPGLMGSLPPGVKPERIDPTSPETSYQDFMRSLQSSSAAGIEFGMSYQISSRDAVGLSYAGGTLVTQMDAQGFKPAQKMFCGKLLSPMQRIWLDFAVLSGAVKIKGYSNDPKFYARHDWLPSGWTFGVNPMQEISRSKASMAARITTLIDECSRLGLNWKSQIRKTKKVEKYADQVGVSMEDSNKIDGGITNAEVDPTDPSATEQAVNVWLT